MNKIDKVIEIIRENMVANAPGSGGGFSSSSPAGGPTAGYDQPLDGRGKIMRRLPPAYRKVLSKVRKINSQKNK